MFDVKPTFLLDGYYGVATVIVIAFAAVAIAMGVKKALKSGKVKMRIFGGEIDVDNEGKDHQLNDEVHLHEAMFTRRQISSIVIKVTEIVSKIAEIKIRTTLHEQMLYVEQKFIVMHDILSRQYANLLRDKVKKIEDATGHEDYLFFNNLLTLTLNNSSQTIKQFLQHNHLESYSEMEFQKYIRDKSDVIIAEAIQFMWSMYPASKMNVTFFEFDTIMSENQPHLRDIMVDIFNESLRISKEKRIEIEILKKELDDFNNNIEGV